MEKAIALALLLISVIQLISFYVLIFIITRKVIVLDCDDLAVFDNNKPEPFKTQGREQDEYNDERPHLDKFN